MTDAEKIAMVKAMSEESDESIVSAYLYVAGRKIVGLWQPYAEDPASLEVPDKYAHIQVEAAVYLLNKRGGEGETSHSENGVYRTYEKGDLPATMLREIVPVVGVIGYEDDAAES